MASSFWRVSTVFTSDHPCFERKQCTLNTWLVWSKTRRKWWRHLWTAPNAIININQTSFLLPFMTFRTVLAILIHDNFTYALPVQSIVHTHNTITHAYVKVFIIQFQGYFEARVPGCLQTTWSPRLDTMLSDSSTKISPTYMIYLVGKNVMKYSADILLTKRS